MAASKFPSQYEEVKKHIKKKLQHYSLLECLKGATWK